MFRILPLIIWLSAVFYMLFQIITSGHDQLRLKDLAIAEVIDTRGSVLVMSQDSPSWQNVRNSFYIYNHDLLSTDNRSWAKIKLDNGDHIVIGPQSQVRIQNMSALPSSMEISLFKGSVNIARPSTSSPQTSEQLVRSTKASHLRVRFDQYSVAVSPKLEQLSIRKGATTNETRIVSKGGDLEIRDRVEGGIAPYTSIRDSDGGANVALPVSNPRFVAADLFAEQPKQQVVKPVPPVPPNPVKLVDAGLQQLDEERQLALRQWRLMPSDLELWDMPGVQGSSWIIPFNNLPDDVLKGFDDYNLRLELKLIKPQGEQISWIFDNNLPNNFVLNRADLLKLGILGHGSPQQSLTWDVKLVASAKGFHAVSILQKYPMRVIQPALGREAIIGLKLEASRPADRRGIVAQRAKALPVQLVIPNASDFRQFAPLVLRSTQFSYRRGRRLPEKGIFIVLNQRIKAALAHSEDLDYSRLGRELEADLIFQGDSSSFLGGQVISYDNLDNISNPQDLYFIYRGSVLQLDQALLQTYPIVKDFLVQFKPLFFSRPIKVLYSK